MFKSIMVGILALTISGSMASNDLVLEEDSMTETITVSAETLNTAQEELENLKVQLESLNYTDGIDNLLIDFTGVSSLEIINVYYGDKDGGFWIVPEMVLPDDYDFRERPPYVNTLEEKLYVAEPYEDLMTQRKIQTVCMTVEKNNKVVGVVGIDFVLE